MNHEGTKSTKQREEIKKEINLLFLSSLFVLFVPSWFNHSRVGRV